MQLIHQYCWFIRTSLLQLRADVSIWMDLAKINHVSHIIDALQIKNSSLILHSFLTDLPGLGEKQNSVPLFEPQAQQ